MLNIGMPELLVILTVGLIVLGPKRLPEIARALGKAMADFRKATAGLTDELENARAMLEEEARQAANATTSAPKIAPASGTTPKTPGGPDAAADSSAAASGARSEPGGPTGGSSAP